MTSKVKSRKRCENITKNVCFRYGAISPPVVTYRHFVRVKMKICECDQAKKAIGRVLWLGKETLSQGCTSKAEQL